jgi:capsular exopolysaccharide synthesis family protein
MSKFFDDTRIAGHSGTSHDDATPIDLEAAVGALKKSVQTNGSGASKDSDARRLLKPIEENDRLTAELAASRLAGCRTIRIPRTEQRSFLVTQYNPAMQAAVEAYRTLRTRLTKRQVKNGMRSLVVSSAAQGEGKTLTAFNLALCYARMENFPLLIVDADLRSQGMSKLLGEPSSPGLAKILEGECDYPSAILGTDFGRLYALPAGSSTIPPPELFSGPKWSEFMGWATETFRLVIVDSPPVLNMADFELLMGSCDSAILVVRSRRTASASLSRIFAEVDPAKLAGVVFNAGEEPANAYGYYSTAG